MDADAWEIRLLLATRETYPTFRSCIMSQYGRHLPACGIRTTLAAMEAQPGVNPQEYPWQGGGELILWPRSKRGRVGRNLAFCAAFLRTVWCRARQFDALVVRDVFVTGAVALALCRLFKVPFFFWLTFPYPDEDLFRFRAQGRGLGTGRWIYTLLRGHLSRFVLHRLLLPFSDHVIVISEAMKDEFAAMGIDPQRMTPNPMGVDGALLQSRAPSPSDDPRLTGKRVLAYLGALDKIRRIDFLFEVLAHVRKHEPDTVLLLIGDTQEACDRAWLEQRARDIGVADSVVWTGWVSREQAWSFAARAEVGLCALPEHMIFQTMSPTKAVEFLALGIPVVVSNNPDQAKLVTESGGGQDAPYTSEPFAQAVLNLLRAPQKAREMGQNGRQYVLRLRSYEQISRDLAATYRQVLVRLRRG